MGDKNIARLFAALEHVRGCRVEQRKEDIIGAENQALVLRRRRSCQKGPKKSRNFLTSVKATRQALTNPLRGPGPPEIPIPLDLIMRSRLWLEYGKGRAPE